MNFVKAYNEMLMTQAERELKKASILPQQDEAQESLLQWRNMQHTQKLIAALEDEANTLLTASFVANNTDQDTKVFLARLFEVTTILSKVKGQ